MLAPVSGLSRGQKWLFATVAVIARLLLWCFVWRSPAHTRPRPPNSWMQPLPVRIAPATRADLNVHMKAIGSVVPINTVTARSRVHGQLLRVLFEEGQEVKAGDLLAAIDPAHYRVVLR